MMPSSDATWADAKNAFEFQKSIGNLRGGTYMGLTEEEIMSKPDDQLILQPKAPKTEEPKTEEGE